MRKIAQIFVAFSEKLNFNVHNCKNFEQHCQICNFFLFAAFGTSLWLLNWSLRPTSSYEFDFEFELSNRTACMYFMSQTQNVGFNSRFFKSESFQDIVSGSKHKRFWSSEPVSDVILTWNIKTGQVCLLSLLSASSKMKKNSCLLFFFINLFKKNVCISKNKHSFQNY